MLTHENINQKTNEKENSNPNKLIVRSALNSKEMTN